MSSYTITTLVDITKPNADRQTQQSNFNILLLTLGLRSNVSWRLDPVREIGRIPFGSGKAAYWSWTFDTEQRDLFLKDSDPVGLLLDDLNGVPVITGLEDTANFSKDAFITQGDHTNTWVSISA